MGEWLDEMRELVDFVGQQIAADEHWAVVAAMKDGEPGEATQWREVPVDHVWNEHDANVLDVDSMAVGPHVVRHDPARVLRDVEAKRRLVEKLVYYLSNGAAPQRRDRHRVRDMLCLLALPYSDAPGYREEWRPPERVSP